jgi:rubrerythrin
VIDAHTQKLLQDILCREGRSVLTYVAEAYPWTTRTEEKTLADLQRLIAAEREAVAGFGRFLVRRRIPLPYLPPYPTHFTTINFLALDFLLPRLIEHERRSIADLERDLAALKDPTAQAEVEKLLALKRRHLPRLEELASAQPQASVT